MWYWLYGRLDVHVAASDEELMHTLDEYADQNIIGGAGMLTEEHRAKVRQEHRDARELYRTIARSI
jgi:hypothetical protein